MFLAADFLLFFELNGGCGFMRGMNEVARVWWTGWSGGSLDLLILLLCL